MSMAKQKIAGLRAPWLLAVLCVCLMQSAQAAYRIDRSLNSSYLLDEVQLTIKNHDFAGAEAQLKSLGEANPSNADVKFWLAKVLAWQGHFDESAVQYQALLTAQPNNSDYLLGQAQALVWSGKPTQALPLIASAQSLNPADPDILRLHIQAQLAIGDAASKAEAVKLTQQAKQLFPKQSWDAAPTASSTALAEQNATRVLDALDHDLLNQHSNKVEAGFGYDSFSNGRGNGNAEYVSFEHRFAPRTVIYSTLQASDKFTKNDLQWLVGGYYPLPSGITLNVEGTISGTHNIVPRDSELLSLQVPMSKGWFITGGLKHNRYNTNDSYQEFGVLEWYFSDYRLAYTLSGTQTLGTTLFGNRLSLSRYYNDISYVTLTLGQAREGERNLGQDTFFDTSAISINGRHWFNKDWAAAWGVGSTRQDSAYTRTGGSLGIRYAF